MALYAGIRHRRAICSVFEAIKPTYSVAAVNKGAIPNKRWNHANNNKEGRNQNHSWGQALTFGTAVGLTAAAVKSAFPEKDVLAEEMIKCNGQEIMDKENR